MSGDPRSDGRNPLDGNHSYVSTDSGDGAHERVPASLEDYETLSDQELILS